LLITGYNKKRDNIIASIENYLEKCEKDGIVSRASLEESGGMGSYETLYITFEIPGNEQDAYVIRFSGHDANYSNPDFALWNDEFKTVTELKKAIRECFEKAGKEGLHCFNLEI
jgi:hypothetical protein